jgi:acetyl-CoA carboxylase carboxyltransferase component
VSWQEELDELRRREALAREMGGADKVALQHKSGKFTIRERIDRLLDAGSFHEIGAITGQAAYDGNGRMEGFTPANALFGRGAIDGRPVVVVGDDFTVRGGSADATIVQKSLMAERMAIEFGMPIVRIVEGSGGGGSVRTLETKGRTGLPGSIESTETFKYTTLGLSHVPVVGLGLGPVAGVGAARIVASHYSVMAKDTSFMFIAGPPVVARTGAKVSKEELGGWEVHTRAGAIDHAAENESDAIVCARRFLSYLPSSINGLPPRVPSTDDPARRDAWLLEAIPRHRRRVYKMRPIIEAVADQGSFFEMGSMFGRALITGLARLDGIAVALMAGDPHYYGGAWDAEACQKVVRFLDLAATFHLPVVYLVDCPGLRIGVEAEKAATIRHATRALAAMNQCPSPWCSVIVRNVFGVAGGIHQPAGRLAFRYAWPSALWGALPLEGGIEAAYKADIAAAADPAAKLQEIEQRLERVRSPFRTAEAFGVEEIIDPRDTRRLLCEFARLALPVLKPGPVSFAARP